MAQVDTARRGKRWLGPADEGRALGLAEFEAADCEPGFRYDLVDGRLEVSPEPNLDHDLPLMALLRLVEEYRVQHPGAFDHASTHARVFPGERGSIGPDLALFTGLRPKTGQNWRDLAPTLVVEALSPGGEKKDLERNRRVYLQVPSILEYWILDPRRGANELTLRVLARETGGGWSEQLVPPDGRYETPLFPGLVVDLSLADLGLAALAAVRLKRAREESEMHGEVRALCHAIGLLLRSRLGGAPSSVIERVQAVTDVALLRELLERASVVQRAEDLFT